MDQNIVSAFIKNDQDFIASFYKEHYDGFIQFAHRYTSDVELLEDIYQDAIIAFRNNAKKGMLSDVNSSAKTYLFGIGKFMVFKALKKQNKTVPLDIIGQQRPNDSIEMVPTIINEPLNYRQQILKKCFAFLGQQCQQMLTSFYYEGLTIEEIASAYDYKNTNVVKSQKSRCLKKLKELISQQP